MRLRSEAKRQHDTSADDGVDMRAAKTSRRMIKTHPATTKTRQPKPEEESAGDMASQQHRRGRKTRSMDGCSSMTADGKTEEIFLDVEKCDENDLSDPRRARKHRKGLDTMLNGPLVCGDDSEYVVLISGDGHSFAVKRKLVLQSSTISNMLMVPPNVVDKSVNEVHLRNLSAYILRKVICYLQYRQEYADPYVQINEDFEFPNEDSLPLLMAANFLQI